MAIPFLQGQTVSPPQPGNPAYGGGVLQNTQAQMQPTQQSSDGGSMDSWLSSILGTGASMWGSQNAGEAATHANLDAINTQKATMGNVNNVYAGQSALGEDAFKTLGSTLGTNGQPADYSNFVNMPGYKFAVDQGTQAIQRAATAQGSAYTPNTLTNIGQYVTGTAMGDYNTYVNQLMGAAGFGQNANAGKASAFLNTGANVSQLQANIGQNQAGAATSAGGALSRFLGGGTGGTGGPNGTGVSGLINAGKSIYNYGKSAYNYLTGGSPSSLGMGDTAGYATSSGLADTYAADAMSGLEPVGVGDVSELSSVSDALSGFSGAGGGAAAGAGAAAAGALAGEPALATIGTGAVDSAVASAGADASSALGGGALAGAGTVALGAGLLAAPFLIGNALSQWSPTDEHNYLNNEISGIQSATPQMNALGQNPNGALGVLNFVQGQWNPAAANFNQLPTGRAGLGGNYVKRVQY